jgi:LIM domain kinase 1
MGLVFPADLLFDIENYKGNQSCDSSMCATPDALQTDEDELDDVFRTSPPKFGEKSRRLKEEPVKKAPVEFMLGPPENQENLMPFIPKSPHLGKDFSPDGERIRNSLRARRKQKILQNRENQRKSMENSVENQLQKCSEILSTKIDEKPYDNTESYVIKLNHNGLISVNSVNDLDSCSDFDSSCDTSLNYHEINNMPLPESPLVVKSPEVQKDQLPDVWEEEQHKTVIDLVNRFENQLNASKNNESDKKLRDRPPTGLPPKIPMHPDSKMNYKNTTEDIKSKLNISKEHKKTGNLASFFPNSTKMFSRFNPLSPKVFRRHQTKSPSNLTPTEKPGSSGKCYRINETPIFERKTVRNMFNFKRSDSDDNIPVKNIKDRRSSSSSGHSSPDKEKLFNFKQKISPTSELKPNHSFDNDVNSSSGSSDHYQKKSSSPSNSTNYKLNKSQKTQFSTSNATTIVPIMSPSTVLNLNARLQDQKRHGQKKMAEPPARKTSPANQKYSRTPTPPKTRSLLSPSPIGVNTTSTRITTTKNLKNGKIESTAL